MDQVIAGVRDRLPDATCKRLKVVHPGADDDGIWFFSRGATSAEVHIESWDGACPFVVEWDTTPERFTCKGVLEAIETVVKLLSA